MEKSMKPKSKYILKNTIKSALVIYMLLTTMLITMFSTFAFATSEGPTTSDVSPTSDVTPPRGRFEFKDVIVNNGINYVNSVEVQVEVKAKDDSDGEIKYYLSSSEILDTEEIPTASWLTYTPGKTDIVEVPSMTELNTIYLVLKDEVGNTSLIYKGANVEYTIEYNENGGEDFNKAVVTKAYYGTPFVITSQVPKREGYFFRGWSTNQNATTASYKKENIIPASVFVGGSKTITLYAVWEEMGENNNILADVVDIGDYVDLQIQYDNVNGSIYNGWRVISVDVDLDGNESIGTVNLVSAGVPLTYYHYNNSSTSETALTNNFLTTPFSSTENYTYRKNGFSLSKTLTETFTSPYVATNDDGTPKVRAMVAEDIYRKTGHSNMETENQMGLNAIKYDHLFANEANYWLASPEDGTDLWDVSEDGYVEGYNSNEYGIRPVLSLRKDVLTTGKDEFNKWEIKISVPIPTITEIYTYDQTERTASMNYFNNELMTVTGNTGKNAGNYMATVTLRDSSKYYWADGTNDPKGIYWVIRAKAINIATMNAIEDQLYYGSECKPIPTIKDGTAILENEKDYTLSYSNNNAIGTATITITGIGNYTGSITTNFTIIPSTYTITYNANGGSMGEVPTSEIKTHGIIYTITEKVPSRSGYVFQGWATNSSATSAEYSAGTPYLTEANLDLYACWKLKAVSSFDYVGGSASTKQTDTHWYIIFKSNGTLTLPENMLVDVYVHGGGGGGGCSGWNSGSGGGGGGGYFGSYFNVPVAGGTPYPVVVGAGGSGGANHANGGRGGTSSVLGYKAEGGYGGYSMANGCGGGAGGSGHGGAGATGKGNYGGGAGSNYTYAFNDSSSGLIYGGGGGGGAPEYGGHGAKGSPYGADGSNWGANATAADNTGAGGAGANYSDDGARTGGRGGSGIVIIRGSFVPPSIYRVIYHPNGGELKEVPIQEDKNEGVAYTVTDKVPTRPGHIFLGWNTSLDSDEVTYVAGDQYTTDKHVILYAVWQYIGPEYTYEGGSSTLKLTYDYWYLFFNESGTFNISEDTTVDLFLIGGGGGGGSSGWNSGSGGGGGGGYLGNYFDVAISGGTPHTITVGAGGTAGSNNANGGRGGTSSAFNYSAGGGYGGYSMANGCGGGAGGSGNGGAGATGKGNFGGPAGSNSTYAFNDSSSGLIYGGGGGGGAPEYGGHGARGTPYGADGSNWGANVNAANNTAGGGAGGNYSDGGSSGGAGGSGIVIIRGTY